VNVVSNVLSLGLIGLLLGQSFDGLFAIAISEKALPAIRYSVRFTLLFIAVMITIELVKDLVRLGRGKLARSGIGGERIPGSDLQNRG